MGKVLLFPVLLIAACLSAGLYGVLHNQISYTVSPDFFHAEQFDRFGMPPNLHNRLGAAVVGFLASWWMGLLIGIPILISGMFMPSARIYVSRSLEAFAVVAGTALFVGLGALLGAFITVGTLVPASGGAAFTRAGIMHNFSYLGGFLAIPTGLIYLEVAKHELRFAAAQRLRSSVGKGVGP
jgi:hypothetical protein